MVAIAQKVRLLAGLCLTLSLVTQTGCVQTRRQVMRQQQQQCQPTAAAQAPVKLGKPAPAGPCELAVRWNNEIATAPDPTRGGELSHGLVGRVYLFNQKKLPVEGDGSLHVELADASVNPPKPLERWNLDADTMQKHLRKDAIGPGYSLFLPWGTYREDLKNVQMKVAYQPKNGTPMYATPSTVVFSDGKFMPMPTASTGSGIKPVVHHTTVYPPSSDVQRVAMPPR